MAPRDVVEGVDLDVDILNAPPARAGPQLLPPPARPLGAGLGARAISLLALAALVVGMPYGGAAAYHALSDSFVAPLILSPDNDLVIQSKLSLARVTAERQTLALRVDQNRAGAEAARVAIARLGELERQASRALDWSRAITDRQAKAGGGALVHLARQRAEVESMLGAEAAAGPPRAAPAWRGPGDRTPYQSFANGAIELHPETASPCNVLLVPGG